MFIVTLANNKLEEYKCDANLALHIKLGNFKSACQIVHFVIYTVQGPVVRMLDTTICSLAYTYF